MRCARLDTLSAEFGMDLQLHDARRKARLLISKQGHCLNDLLFRVHSGQLRAEVAAIVSNHNDYAPLAATYGIPFHHLPVTPDTRRSKNSRCWTWRPASTSTWWCWPLHADPVGGHARALNGRAINIHHSFARFKGARPYHQRTRAA